MKYTILIIDDDAAMHIILKGALKGEFDLLNASDAQEGINLMSEKKIDMIISDIHMPGMDGMEFLEAFTKDADRKNIPFLIMTALPTVEKEQKAFDLGAADFIDKSKLSSEEVLDQIHMKLVSNVRDENRRDRLNVNLKLINQKMMFAAASNDFFDTARSLYTELKSQFALDHISFWTIRGGTSPNLVINLGQELPVNYGAQQMQSEQVFQNLLKTKRSYFNNDILHTDEGAFVEYSRQKDLVAEMGAPVFTLTDKQLVALKMKIPANAPLFAYVLFKRKKLFSEKEHKLLSTLVTRTGSILYRLYQDM